jgi:metal-responsive CopG/Arc/MetJ family transcriptional regulator
MRVAMKIVCISLPPEVLELVDEGARLDQRSRSAYVRLALEHYVRRSTHQPNKESRHDRQKRA